jgi:hypothetical protein
MGIALTAHSGRSSYEEDGVTWYDAAAGDNATGRMGQENKHSQDLLCK